MPTTVSAPDPPPLDDCSAPRPCLSPAHQPRGATFLAFARRRTGVRRLAPGARRTADARAAPRLAPTISRWRSHANVATCTPGGHQIVLRPISRTPNAELSTCRGHRLPQRLERADQGVPARCWHLRTYHREPHAIQRGDTARRAAELPPPRSRTGIERPAACPHAGCTAARAEVRSMSRSNSASASPPIGPAGSAASDRLPCARRARRVPASRTARRLERARKSRLIR